MSLINKILRYSLVVVAIFVNSQEIPPIQIFTPQEYGAEDQNWSITQSDNDFIYVANNKGLLEFNGASWELYDSPNDDILRTVHVVEDKIYSGGYMDFGYWVKNQFGRLSYTSLTSDREFKVKEDEQFWGIINIEGYVLFQSFERIYIYNNAEESFRIIESDSRINKMFKVDETIYFQNTELGIFKIENGKEVLVISSAPIQNIEVVNIFDFQGDLLLLTKENGFYIFKNKTLRKWSNEANEVLSNKSIYCSSRLSDGSFALGTISNGIIQINTKGEMVLSIDQTSGLSNNTILSIKEDNDGNIWLALDNGINLLNLNSPYKVYEDKQGTLGTVYASVKTVEYLYLGTNQGLFYRDFSSNSKFTFIAGTEGQVWSLKVIQGTLFCGHDNGTFIIDQDVAVKVSSEKGTWDIKEIHGKPNLLIQGNYRGLTILEKGFDNRWVYRNKIKGFDISSKYIEFSDSNEILVSHEYKGVYKIKVDSGYENVLDYKRIAIKEGAKSSVLSYNNSVLYSYKEGVYSYDKDNEKFNKDSFLSGLFSGDKYLSGKLINETEGNSLWGFTKNEIIYIEPGKLSNEPEVNIISIPSEVRKNKPGYENLMFLDDGNYLIGTTDGYLIIDINKLQHKSDEIYLNEVAYRSLHNGYVSLNINTSAELENKNNSIQFKYSVANYDKLSSSKYQYRLIGVYDDWSEWTTNSEAFFENLSFGDYTFEARAMTSGMMSSNSLSYNFTIEKPWYIKPIAIVFYIMSFLLLAVLTQYINIRYYKKQKLKLIEIKERELEFEQLENQRQLMQVRNENLKLDIENKNRELGMATMNLVKRNELLNNIKDELSKSKSMDEFKNVINLVNSSLNNTSDWKLFEEAFNNVDKDFMKKIKNLHPSITPNDLRLCAYLRLNLSSKEIAPLLNISHKSVEVKRYRLRKKMGLGHDQSLSNYIIDL
jgi:AraC family chitin signaling transcriptional activator